jgi:hypothetical protein
VPLTEKQAHEMGRNARRKGAQRISPFYEEHQTVAGRRVDITEALDKAWFSGYDEAVTLEAVLCH